MAKDRTAAAQGIATLLTKLNDPDPDIRFMQLSDLANILIAPGSEYVKLDNHTAARIIEGVLRSLGDQHGEVQNQALKCIAPLAPRTPTDIIAPLMDKITDLTTTDIDVSIPNTALRTLIASLPHPQPTGTVGQDVKDAYAAVSKVLIPRLVGHVVLSSGKATTHVPLGLLERKKDKGYSGDAVDVMVETVRCYGSMLHEAELVALAKAVMNIIEDPQAGGVVKKRALAGIGVLLIYFSDAQVGSFVTALRDSFQKSQNSTEHRRFLIATIGTVARATPHKYGSHLDQTVPFVLDALSQEESSADSPGDEDTETDPEIEELRETALVALDAMLTSCPSEMQPHLTPSIEVALRYVKYDPNVAEVDDEEMSGTIDEGSDDGITEDAIDEDDEFAALDDEDAFSDVDDLSWKVRRCAAKVLLTLILQIPPSDHEVIFEMIAPALISRLNNEREDSVLAEVMAATTALVRRIGSSITPSTSRYESTRSVSAGRKRRRHDSEADQITSDLNSLIHNRQSPPIPPASPPSGPQADLASFIPKIVQSLSKLWKKASISLKQAAITMLRALTLTRNGALAAHLQQLEDPIADALKPSTLSGSGGPTSGSTATVASLQVESLSLISAIAETNTNTVLIPFVIALIPPVTAIVRDRNFKVSSESLSTIEQFVKALTPPRASTTSQDHAIHLSKLYEVIVDRVTDNNSDLEVRHRAIEVFGVMLARTSSTTLIAPDMRTNGLGILSDRLKNETTRLASARAIGLVGESAAAQDHIGSAWVQDVSLEMANQLRKADRALRGSCLEALQYFALNPVTSSQYETTTIQQLQTLLMPLISEKDLHLLTPALIILAKLVPTNASALVDMETVKALSSITETRLEGPPLKAYLFTVKVIGESGEGAKLMKTLLTVGTAGDTVVLGRAIGTLLVFGGSNLGVTIESFLKEAQTSSDAKATCLALTVLGEVGLRMGPSSPLKMEVFMNRLDASSDKIRLSAAVALGSAASSNISQYLPIILERLSSSANEDYLYLHSLKEILQHSESAAHDIEPYAAELWQKLFSVSKNEESAAVGAECIGRLAMIDPSTYVPELSKALQNPNSSDRAIVISAFRFTLTDTGTTYNALLARMITPIIKTMLQDSDLSNRRLAVTTLNAAIINKPNLIVSEISQLLPIVLNDSRIKPELIKVIQIGPFKHNEDAGLDLRKSTYGTLYALVDCTAATPFLPIPAIFDRILDGIPDDNDIRTLCNLMLSRLASVDPDETRRRLSGLADKFRIVLGTKIKENAVKQEIERVNEANAAVIRTSLELDKKFPSASADGSAEMAGWRAYLDYIKKDFASVVRNIQNEA